MKRISLCLLMATLLVWASCKESGPGPRSSPKALEVEGPGVDAEPAEPARSSEKEADQRLAAKLRPYIALTNRFTRRVYMSRTRYVSWVSDLDKGPTCKETVLGLQAIASPDREILEVERVQGQAPRLADLEEGAKTYIAAFRKLHPLISRAEAYYRQRDFAQDDCALGRELHPQLVAAWKEFAEGDKRLSAALERHQRPLEHRLLEHIGKEHGVTSERYYHIKVMMDARALMLLLQFELQDTEPDIERIAAELTRFDGLLLEMGRNTENGGALASFRSSAKGFVQAAQEMTRRIRDGRPLPQWAQKQIERGHGARVRGTFEHVSRQFDALAGRANQVTFR